MKVPQVDRGDPAVVRLHGPYYSECQAVFRRLTNQSERMLAEADWLVGDLDALTILSVGSGTGLFELPLLERALANGHRPKRFVGIDIDGHACRTLRRELRSQFGDRIDYQVHQQDFDSFDADGRYDLVLFVHTFEYLIDDPQHSLRRAHGLLNSGGRLLIFSPQRGGINAIYEQLTDGCFSEGLESLLEVVGLEFQANTIEARCDIAPILTPEHPDRLALLSFLTQLDCRSLDPAQLDQFIEYFESLRDPESGTLPHPATAFLVVR